MTVRRSIAVVFVFAALVLSACGSSAPTAAGDATTTSAMVAKDSMGSAGLTGVALDRAFVSGMLPHHQAAVDMAKVELSRGSNEQVKAFAQGIIDSQQKEIGTLKTIAGRIKADPQMEMTGAMGSIMGVPLSTDMSTMADMVAKAGNADQAFLQMMIPHHASAIGMANEEQQNGSDEALLTLSRSIIADQAKEIGQMQDFLDDGV